MSSYEIVAQHPEFWVLDKRPGSAMHSSHGATGIIRQLHESFPGQGFWPVHRLDTVTSGLLVVALNKSAAQRFQELFSSRQIEKYYLAISDKKPTRKQGTIKGDMDKSRRGGWKLSHSKSNPAITQFKSVSIGERQRLFLMHPLTGKTHQVRVALKSLAAPIIGDPRYHPVKGGERCYLHAYALAFPWGDTDHHFVCPPTIGKIFETSACDSALQAWPEPWQLNWPKV